MGSFEIKYLKDEIRNWASEKVSRIEDEVGYLVQDVLSIFQQTSSVLSPFRWGDLRYSLTYEISGLKGLMYPMALHSIFVILGTKEHEIRPVNKMALYWIGAKHPVMKVQHPGTKPNDFIQDAYDQTDIDSATKKILDWVVT